MYFPSSADNNYNINPFSHQLPSSSAYHFPPGQALLTHDSNDILFNHHHDHLMPAALPAANPQLNLNETLANMALFNNDGDGFGVGGGGIQGPGFGFPLAKKAVKKDRHSKICTAQGVRDRRVRLSIEIAREFFDLQDMLGFDKASKTVEWLLRKSKNAIKEVVKMQPYGDQHETVDEGAAFQSNSVVLEELEGVAAVSKEKKMKKLHKEPVPDLQAKESRAKARAKARDRTREKMCSSTKLCSDSSPHSFTQLETFKKSDHLGYGNNNNNNNHSMASSAFKVQPSTTAGASRENVIEESIVIRRMLKPSTILGYQQNYHTTSKDVANNGFPNLYQNWDINGAMPHSTNRLSVNLSTGYT